METGKGKSETGATVDVKKLAKKRRLDFDLHVNLIMRMEDEPKNAALFRAYCEGAEGLAKRLVTPAKA